MSLGSNIKRLREANGMTQEELAKVLGVSPASVSYWESDVKVPRMGAIQKMADRFGVLKSEIIEGPVADGRTFISLYERLSDASKERASSYLRFLAQSEMTENPK